MRERTQRIYKTVSSIKGKAPSFFFPAEGKRDFTALQVLCNLQNAEINSVDDRNDVAGF